MEIKKKTDTDTNLYRAIFKCPESYKQEFNDSKCLVTISVGQKIHEHNKFMATITLINRHFKECVFMVCDSLQRHSIALQDPLKINNAYNNSIKTGDDWIQKNIVYIRSLSIPFKIIRWDYWLTSSEYVKKRAVIDNLYANNKSYKDAIDKTINEFTARFKKRTNKETNTSYFYNTCLEYLFEECAAMLLQTNHNLMFDIYPNIRNPAMTFIYNNLVSPYFPKLLRPIALKFKKKFML